MAKQAQKQVVIGHVRIDGEDVKARFVQFDRETFRVRSKGHPTLNIVADENGGFRAEASERRHVLGEVKAPSADRAFAKAAKQFWSH